MRVFLLMLTVLYAGSCIAQDPHFSQFYSSPLTLNPAFTGKFDGNFRLAANYRNQWPSINNAYETGTASIDFPILKNRISDRDIWGLGFMGYTDKSAAGAVKFNYFSVSTAFHKGLDEDGYTQIGGGFQATYSNMLINTSGLKFGDQLTPLGFTGVTAETFNNATLKANYFDLNGGILFTTSTNDRNNWYAGVSVYHINRYRLQFTDEGYFLLSPRFTLHGGGYFGVGDRATLHVNALYSNQAGAHETLVGGAVQLPVTDQEPGTDGAVSVYGGAWLRFGDALIPYLGIEYNQFRVGASYDINTSSLKTASQSRGGIEISLIYIVKPAGSKGVPCPKF